MVDAKHQSDSLTDGGGDPSIMSDWLLQLNTSLEHHGLRLQQAAGEFHQLTSRQSAYTAFQLNGDRALLNYATKREHVSLEEISDQTELAWTNVMEKMDNVFKDRVRPFLQTILEGATKTQAFVEMLVNQAKSTKGEPHQEMFKLSTRTKYVIDGTPEVKNVQPVWNAASNMFNFHDRTLLSYMDLISQVINGIDLTRPLNEIAQYDFTKLDPKSWLKGAAVVDGDDRFKTDAIVYRGDPVQGNRAIYAAGPVAPKEDTPQSWKYVVRALRSPLVKYYPVPNLKESKDHDGMFEVSPVSDISRRLMDLDGVIKAFLDRKNPTEKLISTAMRLEQSAQRLYSKAKQLKDPEPRPTIDGTPPEETKSNNAASVVLHDTAMMLNNVIRLVTDYFDIISTYLMIIGGLAYAAQLDLQAYIKPREKLNKEQDHG